MLRKLVTVGGLAVAVSLPLALVTATPALAKGATKAMITGPGLAHPIVVADAGEPGQNGNLATLAEQSGLFTVLFGPGMNGSATTLRSSPPQTALGPQYTVTYTVPGVDPQPGEKYGRIRQNLYPYATGGPLTYTPPGQHGFGRELQATGWLRAGPGLLRTLAQLGVPQKSTTRPARPVSGPRLARTGPHGSPGAAIAAAIVAILAGGTLILAGRKRSIRVERGGMATRPPEHEVVGVAGNDPCEGIAVRVHFR
jgi:hypothetical protein